MKKAIQVTLAILIIGGIAYYYLNKSCDQLSQIKG